MAELENEIWKPVVGYEGLYEVSNFGNIKCLGREWVCGNRKSKRSISDHALPKHKDKKGYTNVNLRGEDGIQKHIKIHRLVALAFIPNPENKPQVNHKNGIKTDNMVENLEWATNKENVIHSYKNGLQIPTKGGDRPQARLVLNTQTGIFYDCIRDAANTIGGTLKEYMWLYRQLTGYHKNKTSFILI